MKAKSLIAVLGKRFGVRPPGYDDVAPTWPTLGDVDTADALATYQAGKRAKKAAMREAAGGLTFGADPPDGAAGGRLVGRDRPCRPSQPPSRPPRPRRSRQFVLPEDQHDERTEARSELRGVPRARRGASARPVT